MQNETRQKKSESILSDYFEPHSIQITPPQYGIQEICAQCSIFENIHFSRPEMLCERDGNREPAHNTVSALSLSIQKTNSKAEYFKGFLSVHDVAQLTSLEDEGVDIVMELLDLDGELCFGSGEEEFSFCESFMSDVKQKSKWFTTLVLDQEGTGPFVNHYTITGTSKNTDPEFDVLYGAIVKLIDEIGIRVRGDFKIIIFTR